MSGTNPKKDATQEGLQQWCPQDTRRAFSPQLEREVWVGTGGQKPIHRSQMWGIPPRSLKQLVARRHVHKIRLCEEGGNSSRTHRTASCA